MGLWETLAALRYDWVMRLDDDSKLLSPIRYDLFASLADRRVEYAFRLASFESGFDGCAPRLDLLLVAALSRSLCLLWPVSSRITLMR